LCIGHIIVRAANSRRTGSAALARGRASSARVPAGGAPPIALGGRRRRTSTGSGRRERIVDALTQLVADAGYPSVTVAKVITLAGVSRATFYEEFSDKEDCLVAALASAGECVQRAVSAGVEHVPAELRAAGVVAALFDLAGSQPAIVRVALSEPLASGKSALTARDDTVAALAMMIDSAYVGAPVETPAPDLPSRALVGCASRVLAWRLSRDEPVGSELAVELSVWLASYRVPLGKHRWRKLAPHAPSPRSQLPRTMALHSPAEGNDAQGVSGPDLAAEQRLRLIFATAQLVSRHGYDAVTVADIARGAGVESPTFYRLFTGKRDALQAGGELLFGRMIAASALAFVAGERWPEHLLEAARALLRCLEDNLVLAGAAIVGSHAAAACSATGLGSFAERFSIFLEEGFRHESGRDSPPEISRQAVPMLVLELCYQLLRGGEQQSLSGLLGHVGFAALTPFLGPDEANTLLQEHILLDRLI
jgi:TetR/AcrR family transcriptional regulator